MKQRNATRWRRWIKTVLLAVGFALALLLLVAGVRRRWARYHVEAAVLERAIEDLREAAEDQGRSAAEIERLVESLRRRYLIDEEANDGQPKKKAPAKKDH